ncbi:ketoacyl-ACP synthase III [Selenomonas sp. TAMA-11512]|uniref:beta-ketoacyl-ACP synthase III n=1 Tax=Selenomonas sp. TAMA-11512 TaxID=3095337 RepID=UPI0030879366|nr:ketoacyl-ACP synthase III [Selenomonas sp. TAMA-11512]
MTNKRHNAGILGTGYYVPEKRITNRDIEKMVDTNDAWIVERTGIRERRAAEPGTPVSEIACKAAEMAIEDAGVRAEDLDLIIFATLTPDYYIPSTACVLQMRLGAAKAAAFDLEAACSGFVYASAIAAQFIENGIYKHILVVGAEVLSNMVDWEDRNTCILFGDGAGAAVYGAVPEGEGILAFDLGADGTGGDTLIVPAGGSAQPTTEESIKARQHFMQMDGKAVFRFAVKVMGKTVLDALEKIGMDKSEIDHLIPHQANIRIVQAAAKRLDMPMDKVFVNLDKYGNTSAASIPIAIAEAQREHRFKKGDVIALAGFGAGLTWASCILRWTKEDK